MEISHPGPQHGPQLRAALGTCWGCHFNWNGAGYFHGSEDAMGGDGMRFAMGCGSDFGPKRLRSPWHLGQPSLAEVHHNFGVRSLRFTYPTSSRGVGWPLIFGAFQGLIWGRDTRLLICLTHLPYPWHTSDYRVLGSPGASCTNWKKLSEATGNFRLFQCFTTSIVIPW